MRTITTTQPNALSLVLQGTEHVCLLVDTSGSMDVDFGSTTRLKAASAAIRTICSQSSPVYTAYSLLGFDSSTYCHQTPTTRYLLIQAKQLRTGGTTNMSSGLRDALRLDPIPQRVILLSDGQPNSSREVYDCIPLYQQHKIKIDTIAIGAADDTLLMQLSEATGGRFQRASTPEELAEQYKQLETRNYLQLEHRS